MARARVYVTLKKSVFDPQGKAVHDALQSLGYRDVQDVRQGKFFELELGGLAGEPAGLEANSAGTEATVVDDCGRFSDLVLGHVVLLLVPRAMTSPRNGVTVRTRPVFD